MWEEYFYTESNTNGRFDLLVYYISEDYFEVFLNAKGKDYASGILKNTYLKRSDFDLKIKELTENGVFDAGVIDVSNYDRDRFLIFYTVSSENEVLMTRLKIDVSENCFLITPNLVDNIDGYNIFGDPVDSLNVSNEVFKLLIDGAKARGYKEFVEK